MRALRFAGHLDPVERAELQERFAEHAYMGTQRAEAAEVLSEAIDTHRRAGDLLGEAVALRSRARLLCCIGRFPEARKDVVEAVKLLERVPPGPELALAREAYAAYRGEEDLVDAVRLAREAAVLAEQVGDLEVMASTIGTLGVMRMRLGDEGGAADLQRNLELSIEQGSRSTPARRSFPWPRRSGGSPAGARWRRSPTLVSSTRASTGSTPG